MNGQDLIDYIKDNNLEKAVVTVTATMYYNGDHECRTTENVNVYEGSRYLGKGKSEPTINFYVDSELY